jgi:translation initiation factor eIF-2B subunit beta
MRLVVAKFNVRDFTQLIERVQHVGQKLTLAQPREIAVGNVVRRVLGVIRDESEEDRNGEAGTEDSGSVPQTPWEQTGPLMSSHLNHKDLQTALNVEGQSFGSIADSTASRPSLSTQPSFGPPTAGASSLASMFDLLSHPLSTTASQSNTPGYHSPSTHGSPIHHSQSSFKSIKDLRAEVIEGIDEIIDELDVVDDQIASYAVEHIHSNEIVLIHGSSTTVQKFLLKAAAKRKFTVIHAESYPNNHQETHATMTGKKTHNEDELSAESFSKPLIAYGITVILIPDAAVFAMMSRVNKVILGTHVVLANGGLVAAAGSRVIAQAARTHRTPVVIVTGVYKLSPLYPFDFDALIEYGDSSKVLNYDDGDLVGKVDVENPLFDYVPADLVDLYITNL